MSRKRRKQRAAVASRQRSSPVEARDEKTRESSDSPPPDRLRPWLLGAMTALLVARPMFPSESAATHGDGLPVVMLWIALAVFWMLGAIGRTQFRVCFGWTDVAVLLLIALHTIAALWGAAHGSPRPAVNMLWEWIGLGLTFFLARQFVVGPREVRAVVAVMIAVAVALSGYGLYQYFDEFPSDLAAYEADPEGTLRAAGLQYAEDSPERELFERRLATADPTATFALTNSLAGYLGPWLIVLVGIGVGGRADSSPHTPCAGPAHGVCRLLWSQTRWPRWLAATVCTLPIVACLLLTRSRSGCLAAGLGVVLVALSCRTRRLRIGWRSALGVVVVTAILVAAGIAAGRLDRSAFDRAAKSFGYRLQYWQATWRMIGDYPWLGCGPGNFQNVYTAYKAPDASEEVADPHNFVMEVWATAGTPAVLALAAVLGCFAWTVVRGGQRPVSAESPYPNPLPEGEGTGGGNPFARAGRADASAFVLVGGLLGFALGWLLGQLSAAPPGMAGVVLGLPLAAGALAALSGWIRHGRLPVLLPAIGVVVLLIDLLAAGGIGFPAVAATLWLLMALGLNRPQEKGQSHFRRTKIGTVPHSILGPSPHPSPEGRGDLRTLPRSAALAGLVLAIGLAATCYTSAYSPVLRCQSLLRSAEQSQARGDAPEAERRLRAAAVADPLAAEPWGRLAVLALAQWSKDLGDEDFGRFAQYNDMALKRAGNAAPVFAASGDRYREAFEKIKRRNDTRGADELAKAIEAYRRAVELYPNSALYRAKLALAYRAARQEERFRAEADEALRLHELTPHTDKKLPEKIREQLLP